MSEPTTITGSVEVLTNDGESIGEFGVRWTLAAVPIVLEAKHGITDLASVDPVDPRDPERIAGGPELVAQWFGTDNRSQPVTVRLWRGDE